MLWSGPRQRRVEVGCESGCHFGLPDVWLVTGLIPGSHCQRSRRADVAGTLSNLGAQMRQKRPGSKELETAHLHLEYPLHPCGWAV